jgi:preprotein translocase subunit SecG
VYYLLLTLLLIDAIVLMVIVLLQAGKGGGLAAMGAAGAGSDTLFGSRQAATILTKATWWAGGIFLTLSFALSMLAGGTGRDSILRGGIQPAAPPASAPALPGFEAVPGDAPAPAPGATAPPATPAPAEPPPGQ